MINWNSWLDIARDYLLLTDSLMISFEVARWLMSAPSTVNAAYY